jgi:uncharacterized peroxidase-related enzyme
MEREPRVARIDSDAADPSLRESFETFVRARGKVPNLFRITARRPAIGRTLADHMAAVMGEGDVDGQLKELLAVRVSQVNGCEYCLASHSLLAKRKGATGEQLSALANGDLSAFPHGWQAPLAAADEMTTDRGQISPATYDRLGADWTPAQIVEIVSVIGLFNYFNRIANALDIPPTT